jgi:hypothetical protein
MSKVFSGNQQPQASRLPDITNSITFLSMDEKSCNPLLYMDGNSIHLNGMKTQIPRPTRIVGYLYALEKSGERSYAS